ncbi:hypothetical protein Tco_1361438 [Tanacetum coccineum]
METCDPVGTLMEIKDKLDLDKNETLVDATKYRSMIGALMYLMSSRPDIVHATCLCARYQAQPTEKYLKEVKRIFRYLWGIINMGLWRKVGELVIKEARLYSAVNRRSRICVSIRLLYPSPLDADTENVEKGTIELYIIKTDYQLADLFIKALLVDRFNYLVRRLDMEESNVGAGNFVDKIKNIDGKIIKDGKLRTAMRGIALNQPAVTNDDPSMQAKDTGSSRGSFASLLKNPNSHAATKAVRLKVMNNSECVQGAIVAIPLAAVREQEAKRKWDKARKRLAFPLVENYVKNAWAKFCLERPMLKKGFFFFQFLTREGMEKDSIVVAIPFPDGTGHSLETVDIKYEWVPPWCDVCKIFDHVAVDCPKREKVPAAAVEEEDDRFTKVNRKNGKKKQNVTKQVAGIKFSKPKPNIIYRPIFKQSNNEEGVGLNQNKPPDQNKPHEPILTKSQPITKSVPNKSDDSSIFFTRNSFESLMSADLGEGNIDPMHATSSTYCDPGKDDEEEVEEVYNECDNQKGASTLSEVWKWTSNELSCSKGSRIILGRNPNIVNVVIISFNDQVMHACIAFKAEKKELFYFNVSLSADESSVGTSYIDTGMRDFQECVENIKVADVNSTGLRFTWNQKPMGNDGNLNENVKKLRYELDEEERFLFQKAKIDWLKLGDANTAYFHKLVKSQVPLAFINHYTEFLGQPGMTSHFDSNDLFCKRLSNEAASFMIREVSDKEIKEALFSLGDNKAPGPNGYSAAYFKDVWDNIWWMFYGYKEVLHEWSSFELP